MRTILVALGSPLLSIDEVNRVLQGVLTGNELVVVLSPSAEMDAVYQEALTVQDPDNIIFHRYTDLLSGIEEALREYNVKAIVFDSRYTLEDAYRSGLLDGKRVVIMVEPAYAIYDEGGRMV